LFAVTGLVVIVAGIGLAVFGAVGVVTAIQRDGHPLLNDGPRAITSAFGQVCWGLFVFTIGRYLWRGARSRGWKDRVGRLLIITGLVVVGFAVQTLLAGISDLMRPNSADDSQALLALMIRFALIGIPGSLIAMVGVKMAREEVLITASANASF
jgi:hypothetical protein